MTFVYQQGLNYIRNSQYLLRTHLLQRAGWFNIYEKKPFSKYPLQSREQSFFSPGVLVDEFLDIFLNGLATRQADIEIRGSFSVYPFRNEEKGPYLYIF